MYLWSIDLEAVLVSMSCFSLLCEEADIRCGSDEMTANFILPNYHVYEVSFVPSSWENEASTTKRQLLCDFTKEHC